VWMMLEVLQSAQQLGLSHVYLCTAYGHKGLYKTNFSPLEWWDGAQWSTDRALLRRNCRDDAMRQLSLTDQWKGSHDFF